MQKKSGNTGNIVTFGEVLMRLSPSDNRKMQQSNSLNFFFGGTEMNVAASLSSFGLNVKHVTNVSNDHVGDAAIASMRQMGIDVSAVNKVDHPLGIYFLEPGSGMRASVIAYNRLHGSFANIIPEDVDWDEVFSQCDYFHWTGISPGISKGAYETLREGLMLARERGITVSADPAYRSNLWKYGKNGKEVLAELIGFSNIFIGGVNEINEILGTNFGIEKEEFIAASKELQQKFPGIEKVFDKVRTGVSASWQKVYGRAWTGEKYLVTPELEITDVVDRIGTGDAYAAGILYGLQHFENQHTLEFANAACALKHTILGDANLVSVDEVQEIVDGSTGGRIKR